MSSGASIIVGGGSDIDVGSVAQLNLGAGEIHDGIVEVLCRGRGIGLRIPDLNESWLFVEIEPGAKDTSVGFWLSTYGLKDAQKLGDRFVAQVKRLTGASD